MGAPLLERPPCGPPTLPGTANVLPPAGVPPAASAADGGEYEYLLDYPEQEAPDPDNPSDLKCDVAGVYWDKRSWIASWYEGGKRYYKSFSAKTHGFYRSKYWAIKVLPFRHRMAEGKKGLTHKGDGGVVAAHS
ncbi:AP2 domain transcription factor ap2xi-5 [Cyclospora cayetanensis]|uniref:AP2 domain transcription factor ap2xi-5 n=1 Tax=Cyclospora cayetanensis TaxID=88456 RepID=A0A1D3DAS8_9EIME|nr:AP2 domain transcription factor ap2xi-5 [Cyclospora cayetanensis]